MQLKLFGSLKLKLDAEWNRPGVRCSEHITKWAEHAVSGYQSELTGLWWRPGKKSGGNKIRLATKRNRPG